MHSELFITKDGSHTLFVPEIDECYHSTHGAIQESIHVFIEAGLKQFTKTEINVLEIGFGTGLNAFLSLEQAKIGKSKIHFTTIEKYPVELEKALKLNYANGYSDESKYEFELIHKVKWNEESNINPFFSITKYKGDFTQFDFEGKYDVIFFDAFSPEKQPEMWSEAMFKKIYQLSNSGAILTTYCAKGIVRRALQSAGFTVERLPGPPGKREILRATKA